MQSRKSTGTSRRGLGSRAFADELVQRAVRGELDVDALADVPPEVVALALLAAAKRIFELEGKVAGSAASLSTPSGMVPVYEKPNLAEGKPGAGRKTPGAVPGHPGVRRPKPVNITERQEHRLPCCPHCRGELARCNRSRTRIIEDTPRNIEPVVTEHTIHRDYCPACKKHVEPVVPDAMPRADLGHNVVSLTSWFHYRLGVTIDQVIDILQHHLQTKLSAGGLVQAWQRTAQVLEPWYEEIAAAAKASTRPG